MIGEKRRCLVPQARGHGDNLQNNPHREKKQNRAIDCDMSHSGSLFYRAIAGAAPANLPKAALFPFSHSPPSKVALFRPSDVDVQLSQSQTGEEKKKHGLQPVVLIMIGLIRGCHGFRFCSPGCLWRGLKGVLCDTARMARLMAALVFKLIPSSCRRLFFVYRWARPHCTVVFLCAFVVLRPRGD